MSKAKVRLPYVVLAMVTVVGASWAGLEAASGAVTTIDASPPSLVPGYSTTVRWANIPSTTKTAAPSEKDWIGLYVPSNAPDTAFVAWRYTESTLASGSEQFFVPAGVAGGNYEFRLFSNDSFTRLAVSPVSFVDAVPSVQLRQVSASRGTSQGADWFGIRAPTPKDWIALYPSSTTPDSAFIAWRYTDSTSPQGGESLTVPANAPLGSEYRIRLFANDGFTRLAISPPFSVT